MRPASRQYPRENGARAVSRDARDLAPVTRGLGALWSADDGLTRNGLTIASWQDFAPGGASSLGNGTAAAQPTLTPGAVGARQSLRFDGSNDVMSRAVGTPVDATTQGVSLVFVAQGRSGSTGDYPPVFSHRPWTGAADAGWAVCANGSGQSGRVTAHYADGTTGFDQPGASSVATRGLSTTQPELWCVVFDHVAQRLRFWCNGALDVERAPTWPSAVPVGAGLTSVGSERASGGGGTRFLAMDLFRIAVHTVALREDEVAAYWSRWGSLCGVRR